MNIKQLTTVAVLLMWSGLADAKKNKGDEGIEIEITVLDSETSEPIPTGCD